METLESTHDYFSIFDPVARKFVIFENIDRLEELTPLQKTILESALIPMTGLTCIIKYHESDKFDLREILSNMQFDYFCKHFSIFRCAECNGIRFKMAVYNGQMMMYDIRPHTCAQGTNKTKKKTKKTKKTKKSKKCKGKKCKKSKKKRSKCKWCIVSLNKIHL